MLQKYGIDVVRLYILCKAPPEAVLDWNERDILGQQRWIFKFYRLAKYCTDTWTSVLQPSQDPWNHAVQVALQRTITNVTGCLEQKQFHTAISFLIKFLNVLLDTDHVPLGQMRKSLGLFCRLLHPMAPIMSSEVWSM